jgi:hypothetical protein
MPPEIGAFPHVVYTSVVGCVVGSNVEAPDVCGYTHAHALMALRHACSGLGFLWMSHLGGWESSVVGCDFGANVEAPDVCGNTHAHAWMALRHACSGLGFLWMSIAPWRMGMPQKFVCVHMLCI